MNAAKQIADLIPELSYVEIVVLREMFLKQQWLLEQLQEDMLRNSHDKVDK